MIFRRILAIALLACCLFLCLMGLFIGAVMPSGAFADDSVGVPIPPIHSNPPGDDSLGIDTSYAQAVPIAPSEQTLIDQLVNLVQSIF